MPKRCTNCGEIKKLTFRCSDCNKIICLNCYNFILDLCANCEIRIYGENYKIQIDKYVKGVSKLEV